jgi:hypothetical protein
MLQFMTDRGNQLATGYSSAVDEYTKGTGFAGQLERHVKTGTYSLPADSIHHVDQSVGCIDCLEQTWKVEDRSGPCVMVTQGTQPSGNRPCEPGVPSSADRHSTNRLGDRAHFLATAARLMRRVLVDSARAKRYQKRGGVAAISSVAPDQLSVVARACGLLSLWLRVITCGSL